MRTLNRPMFRYGGPIKEGVMHGIREPHAGGGRIGFKDGPKKKIFGWEIPGTGEAYDPATNQPYDPKYIQKRMKEERDKMTNVLSWLPAMRAIKGAGWSYKLGKPAIKKLFQAPVSKSKDLTKYTGPVTTGSDKWFGNIFRPAYQGVKESLKGAAAPLKDFKTAIGLGIPAGGYGLAKGYDAWKKRQEGTETTTLDGPPGSDNPFIEKEVIKELTAAETEAAETAARKKKMDSYREIMDIKGMSKDAAYDSLIAASQAINESGDFKGDLKSGKLINQIIQGTSKAFDKPKATKDALNSLLVKSKIASDLKAESGGPLMQQAKDMVAAGGASNIKEAMEYLSKKPAVADTAMTYAKQLGKSFIDESIAILSMQKEFGERPVVVLSEKIFEEKQKEEGFKGAGSLFEIIKTKSKLGPGYYVIGGNGFSIDAEGSTKQVL